MNLSWVLDPRTTQNAATYPGVKSWLDPTPQFAGCQTDTGTWNDRVIQPPSWGNKQLKSSPEEIISQFRNRRYTQGLALAVSWGGMGRRSKDIYGDRKPQTIEKIERVLRTCAESVESSKSIDRAWKMLTGWNDGELGWSSVMSSKALHFLCRASGFERNPPVPIDGAIIRERLWPSFRNACPTDGRPGDWEGNSLEAYSRYMTAILTWAELKEWTTTQAEATIFNHLSR